MKNPKYNTVWHKIFEHISTVMFMMLHKVKTKIKQNILIQQTLLTNSCERTFPSTEESISNIYLKHSFNCGEERKSLHHYLIEAYMFHQS